MMIIGCDFHPSWQQIAWLEGETGEAGEQKLVHAPVEIRSRVKNELQHLSLNGASAIKARPRESILSSRCGVHS